MFSKSANRLIWAVMLVVVAVLVYQTNDSIEGYLRGVGRLNVESQDGGRTVVMTWRGEVNAPMESRIAEAYARHRDSAKTFVLSLASPGGSLAHGARVARLLREIARTHHLVTEVGRYRRCASMCVPVYLQGEKRTAAGNAYFMFHEVSFRDFFDDKPSAVPASATTAATDELFKRYFTPAGVPETWIRQMRAQMAGGNDVWRTADELKAEGSGIVQTIQ